MTRPVMILVFSVLINTGVQAKQGPIAESRSDSLESLCCKINFVLLVKIKDKISHSKDGKRLNHSSQRLASELKLFFKKRRQKRHFRHFAHSTMGRRSNHHNPEKMLKDSAQKQK